MNMKTCSKCGYVYALSDFKVDSRRPSGIGSVCKSCDRNAKNERVRRAREEAERVENESRRAREEWVSVDVDKIFNDAVTKKSAHFDPRHGGLLRTRYGFEKTSDSNRDYQVVTSLIEKKFESSFLDDFNKLNSEPKINVPNVSSDLFLPLDLGNTIKAVEVPLPFAQQNPPSPKASKDDFMSGMPDEDFLLYASGILEKAGNVLTELTRRVKTASNKRIS